MIQINAAARQPPKVGHHQSISSIEVAGIATIVQRLRGQNSRKATSHASSGEIGGPANARSADFCAAMATSGYTEAEDDVRTFLEPRCAFRTVAQSVA